MTNISTLQQSLINAKRVMNKVDTGSFTKSDTTLPMTQVPTQNINMESVEGNLPPQQSSFSSSSPNLKPKASLTEEKIKNSKLPNAIKKAMIDNPIPDIPFNAGGAGLSEEFLSGVKNQMDKQGIPVSESQQSQQNIIPPLKNTIKKKLSSKNLKAIIKESVKELLDETIGFKKDSDENFQFRVGDRIFYGKITSSKSVK